MRYPSHPHHGLQQEIISCDIGRSFWNNYGRSMGFDGGIVTGGVPYDWRLVETRRTPHLKMLSLLYSALPYLEPYSMLLLWAPSTKNMTRYQKQNASRKTRPKAWHQSTTKQRKRSKTQCETCVVRIRPKTGNRLRFKRWTRDQVFIIGDLQAQG